jgi:hypothetical protein
MSFLVLLLLTRSGFAVKVANLPEVMKPQFIQVDGDELFVVESSTCSIYVYSLKDFKLKLKLGKRGEGPGEFKVPPNIRMISPKSVLATARGKMIWFSRKGKIIKEKTIKKYYWMTPIKDNYIAMVRHIHLQTVSLSLSAVLLNSQFEEIKELARINDIYRLQHSDQSKDKVKIYVLQNFFGFWFHDDKVFIANSQKGFFIDVFDSNGKHLYSIDKNPHIEKMKVDDAYKKKMLDYIKIVSKIVIELYGEKSLIFFEYFPKIRSFRVDEKRIYVTTYKEKDDKHELIILDLKGNILTKLFLPFKSQVIDKSFNEFDPWTVHKGMLYEIVTNEETEMSELHKTDLSPVKK